MRLIDEQTWERWQSHIEPLTVGLVSLYQQEQEALTRLFGNLQAARYLPKNSGEFMCWYDHLTYAHTIDILSRRGLLEIPSSRFTVALWQLPS